MLVVGSAYQECLYSSFIPYLITSVRWDVNGANLKLAWPNHTLDSDVMVSLLPP